MPRLLVTGASGLLGANLVLTAAGIYETVGLCYRHPIALEGVEVVCTDLSQPGAAGSMIETYAPDWVVHCAAATDVDSCDEDPQWAYRINRDMASWVAEATWAVGARLVQISTDAVFDGVREDYRESDTPNPINVYASSKLAGEEAVVAGHPEAAIVRTNFYGWNAQPKHSLAEWFLERLERGQSCPGFTDVWVTPILVNDLSILLLQILEEGLKGIFHVVGSECVSKYEFGLRLAKIFRLEASLLEPISVDQAGLRAPRARRLCLCGEKIANALGVQLPSVDDGLNNFRMLREEGFPTRLKELMRRS